MQLSNILKPTSSGIFGTLTLFAFFTAIWLSEPNTGHARNNPGWGNAIKVCGTPVIDNNNSETNSGNQQHLIKTGFYHIGLIPNPQNLYLNVSEKISDTIALLPSLQSTPAKWLVTVVGSDLYQISICDNEKPRCLILGPEKRPMLGSCTYEAYGAQAWWTVGILQGPGAGGWEIGSDGIGRLECLSQTNDNTQLEITTCDPSGKPASTWKLEPILNEVPAPLSSKSADLDVVTYDCTSGAQVLTAYDKKRDQMQVQYNDQVHILTPVISGSGAKFGGSNLPWGWWTKADEGFLFAYEKNGDEGGILDRCQEIDTHNQETAANPSLPPRHWSTQGTDNQIRLMDCTDCGDDIGIMVACQGPAKPALVTVNWAASERDQTPDSLSLEINGTRYQRDIETTTSGMLGFTPQFLLSHNDPLIGALKSGASAQITFGEITTQIDLTGSAFAFDIFDAHCDWQLAATPPSNPAIWFEEKYLDHQSNQTTHALIYGIPQTDAINFVSACHPGNPAIDLRLLVETDGQPEGSPYAVHFKSGTLDKSYHGKVFSSSEEYEGLQLILKADDLLWTAISTNDALIVTPQIGTAITLNTASAAHTISKWQASCKES